MGADADWHDCTYGPGGPIAVRRILQDYPRLVDTRRNRSGADAFVIGLAMVEGITVVTDERRTGRAERPPMPDV